MSEYQTSLNVFIYIQTHDGKCVNVDGLEAEHKFVSATGGIPPIDHKMCVSDIQLVRVSHQEPHIPETVLLEAQDVNTQLVIVVVAQNVEVITLLIVGYFSDHSNFV